MATEPTVEEVQEKLLKVRQQQGISETVKPIRSIAKKQLPEKWERPTICSIHNEPLNENWNCPKCIEAEKEWERKYEEEQKIKEEKRCKEIADNPEPLLINIGVGKRHLPCSFENYQGGEKLKSICMSVVKEPCDLVLTGNAGSGKTHLAVAIFREWIKNQTIKTKYDRDDFTLLKNAKFITVPDLLLKIRQSFSEGSDKSEEDIVETYSSYSFLLLDDLGAEKTTEWSITTLYTIIDRRYRELKTTIVTTNLTIDQIGSQISDRIASRLSSGKVIKINAPDYRKKR